MAVLARHCLGPIIIITWIMLLYTGLMGHFPEVRSILTPQLDVLPEFNLVHWLVGINTHHPESHSYFTCSGSLLDYPVFFVAPHAVSYY
jgi:hypothetical protein